MMEPSSLLNGPPEPESPWQQKSMQLQQQVPVNTGLQEVVTLQVGVQPTDQLQASVAGVGQSTTFQEESQSNNLTTKPLTWPQQQEWLDQILPPVVPFEPLTSMSDTLLKAEAMGNADKHALWQEQELQPLPDTYEDAIKQLGHGPVNMGANQQQEFALQGQPEAIQQEMQQQLLQQQQQCFKLQAVNMQVPNQTQPAKIAPAPLAPSSSSITGGLPGSTGSQTTTTLQAASTGKVSDTSNHTTTISTTLSSLRPSYHPLVPDSPISSTGVSASLPGTAKNKSRIINERKRRHDIECEFGKLKKLIPSLSRNPKAKFSRVVILEETGEHIKKLKSELAEVKEDRYLLQQKVTSQQEIIKNLSQPVKCLGPELSLTVSSPPTREPSCSVQCLGPQMPLAVRHLQHENIF